MKDVHEESVVVGMRVPGIGLRISPLSVSLLSVLCCSIIVVFVDDSGSGAGCC